MKRIVLFLATNLAIVVVLTIVARITGLDAYLARAGGSLEGLLVFAAFFGFAGSFISLALSKWMAKRAMGVQVIAQPRNTAEQWLVSTVQAHARAAGIGMPEVGVFDSPEPNAFATGARRDHALVAVSTGLLARMGEDEVRAVLGHEVTHVANGDMVTLTLIQGVVNTFVIFLIVMWFSRQREFRADKGGAKLAGTSSMISALERLKAAHEPLPSQFAAFGIASGGPAGGLRRLFMSHPPLDERIAALRSLS